MAETVTVLGAGSWGTALAEVQARLGHQVRLWGRTSSHLQEIQKTRENRRYHPGRKLSPNIQTEPDLLEAVAKAELIILATPSHAFRETLVQILPRMRQQAIVIDAAKGIELGTLKTISSVAAEVMGAKRAEAQYAILSGPTFAKEVMRGTPTMVTVASRSEETANKIQAICHSDTFHIFTSDDVIGVELGGALKNVIAIAAGASDGLQFGLNARASLITRGLAEISRMGAQQGANPLTFAGLAGLGDLILTCTGDLSRNRQFGLQMAQGKSLRTALRDVGQVVEGIRTAKAAYELAQSLSVEVPILEEIYTALFEGKSLEQTIRDLLSRPPTRERD